MLPANERRDMEAVKTTVALALIAIGPNLYAGVSLEGGISLVEDSTLHDAADASTKVSFDPGFDWT